MTHSDTDPAVNPEPRLPVNSPGLTAGGFSPAEAIRRCATVAECHALRASLGEMDSATYMALLMRIEALRKLETIDSDVQVSVVKHP